MTPRLIALIFFGILTLGGAQKPEKQDEEYLYIAFMWIVEYDTGGNGEQVSLAEAAELVGGQSIQGKRVAELLRISVERDALGRITFSDVHS